MTDDRTERPGYVLVYAAVVSTLFTGCIMALHAASRAAVQRNEKLAFQKAMVELFDLGDVDSLTARQIASLYEKHITQQPDVTDPQTGQTFKAYTAAVDHNVRGYAFSFTGTGFWARIDGLLAVSPAFLIEDDGRDAKILGITFLSHQETPGLGGRITERQWRRKFAGLTLTPPKQGGQWIYIGGETSDDPASPRYNRRVDAITGATGTSNALERFLNEQIAAFRRAMLDKYAFVTISF